MQILAITDLYPPHYIGGYEIACRDVTLRLAARGHGVRVLTSDYRRPGEGEGEGDEKPGVEVMRVLPFLPDRGPWGWDHRVFRREGRTQRVARRLIRRSRPDVISIWNMGGVSPVALSAALMSGVPVVFSVSDYWLAACLRDHPWLTLWRHESGPVWKRWVKRGLEVAVRALVAETRVPRGSLRHATYFSAHLEEAYRARGFCIPESAVIHHGVDLDTLRFATEIRPRGTRLLFVGRLDPRKGVHVAIEAVAILARDYGRDDLTLDIVGEASSPEYMEHLRRLADDPSLAGRVRFLGRRDRDEIFILYSLYDILLFPSIWKEPFSISLIEAMAVGLPVVATDRGGSVEIVRDGENALVAAAEDPRAMAAGVDRLVDDPSLRDRLRRGARRSVEARCDIESTVDRIEEFLGRARYSGACPAPDSRGHAARPPRAAATMMSDDERSSRTARPGRDAALSTWAGSVASPSSDPREPAS